MRYVLAGGLVAVGLTLIGLAVRDTITQAWQALSQ